MSRIFKKDKKVYISAAVFSLLFSLAAVIGHAMYETNDFFVLFSSAKTLCLAFAVFLVLAALIFFPVSFLYSVDLNSGNYSFLHRRRSFFLIWLVLFLFWLPCYLAYYPGVWGYDISYQAGQIISGQYTSHHPPLHTFILEVFFRFFDFDYAKAISVFGLCQMLFISGICALFIHRAARKRLPKALIIISFAFFALNPIVAIFSFIPVKDVSCACFLMLLALELIELSSDSEKYFKSPLNLLRFSFLGLLFCLFRNNAAYALPVCALVLLFIFKRNRIKVFALFLVPCALYFSISLFIYPLLGIEKGRSAEMLSVPLQQLARAVSDDPSSLSEEDAAAVSRIFSYKSMEEIAELYNPRFADPIKDNFDDSVGFKGLLTEWLKLLPEHLKSYVNAFLSLHLPYWYPAANAKDEFSGRVYIETNVDPAEQIPAPFYVESKFPKLLEFYQGIATYSALKNLPQVFNIFSLSFALWFMLFCFFGMIARGYFGKTAVIILPLSFWATFILGPVSNLRYIVPIIFLYPIMLVSSFAPELYFRKKS